MMESLDQPGSEVTPSMQPHPLAAPPNFMLWTVLCLVMSLVFCGGWFLSVPGAVSALAARNDWNAGHRHRAAGKLRVAKILCLAGALIGALLLGALLAVQGVVRDTLPPLVY